jgi:hypothetical protein
VLPRGLKKAHARLDLLQRSKFSQRAKGHVSPVLWAQDNNRTDGRGRTCYLLLQVQRSPAAELGSDR